MRKEVMSAPNCTIRLYILFAAIALVLLLYLIAPGDVKRIKTVIEKHVEYITQTDSFDIDYVQDHLLELDQEDPQLIQYARIRHLTPPSKLPYSFTAKGDFKDSFSSWVAKFFQNMEAGIFIEAGANEGERGSHTLYLEKELGWTGLLIECNPTVVPYLKSHHRKAWVADTCIAPTTTPRILNFSNPVNWSYSGTFRKAWKLPIKTEWKYFEVGTMPLYTLIAALGWTEVDYFCFDVEGAELSILKTLPFDKIIFKVLVIEIYFYTTAEKKELDELLKSKGYNFVKTEKIDNYYVHDSVKHLLSNVQH